MKITFLGGGALRLLGAVDEILKQREVFVEPNLVFMDTDPGRAQTVAALARKMPSALVNPPATQATDDLDAALHGASFVYCCIRVGGVRALERDKKIGSRWGFHGHDDFGPSAIMLTARTVPVVLDIARRMQTHCPGAWLLIFSNPITTLVDAVTRHTPVRNVGLCDGVYNFAWDMDALFDTGVPCPDLAYSGGGLNHLSWITPDTAYKNQRVMDMIWEQWDELAQRRNAARCDWKGIAPLVKMDRVMPLNNGHQVHYFYHDKLAAKMHEACCDSNDADLRSSKQDRAAAQAAQLAQQDQIEGFWDQTALQGCQASPFGNTDVKVMKSIHQDSGDELIVTTPNHGHIADLLEGAPVEAPVHVWRNGLEPVGIDPVPTFHKGLCNAVAYHQRLVVDASMTQDRHALFTALMAEPTIRSLERAAPMFDELWAAHESANE